MKKNKGITLIALVIAIIVLLILVGVTIATLTGDNGLLKKAQESKELSKDGEIEEQIKLAYLEWKTAQLTGAEKTDIEYMTESLEQLYGEDSIKDIKVNNKKYTVEMRNGTKYKFNSETGISSKCANLIDYKGKNSLTVVSGDEINIGTQRFMVLKNNNGKIVAMPWYNITLPSNLEEELPVQDSHAGGIAFSVRPYWSTDEDGNEIPGWKANAINKAVDIDLNDKLNNIQKYIDAYEEKLESLGANDIIVRAAKKQELEEDGITELMRNPGQTTKYFWLDSGHSDISVSVWAVYTDGNIYAYRYNNSYGVRPIIEIPIQ